MKEIEELKEILERDFGKKWEEELEDPTFRLLLATMERDPEIARIRLEEFRELANKE